MSNNAIVGAVLLLLGPTLVLVVCLVAWAREKIGLRVDSKEVPLCDAELQAELKAWERASDEALIHFEATLNDNTTDTPSAIGVYNG